MSLNKVHLVVVGVLVVEAAVVVVAAVLVVETIHHTAPWEALAVESPQDAVATAKQRDYGIAFVIIMSGMQGIM